MAFEHIKVNEHKISGHRFRVIEDPSEFPYLRSAAYFIAAHDLGRKATTADIEAFCDLMREAINKQDIASAGYLINALDANNQLYASFAPVFDMGSCFILIDGEPMNEIPQKFHDEKYRLFSENEEIRGFFLSQTLAFWKSMNQDLDISQALTYLSQSPEHAVTTEIFLDAIDSLKRRKSPTDSIKKHSGFQSSPDASSTKSKIGRWLSITRWLRQRSG